MFSDQSIKVFKQKKNEEKNDKKNIYASGSSSVARGVARGPRVHADERFTAGENPVTEKEEGSGREEGRENVKREA